MREVDFSKAELGKIRSFVDGTPEGQRLMDFLVSKLPIPSERNNPEEASFVNGRIAGHNYCIDCIYNLINNQPENG